MGGEEMRLCKAEMARLRFGREDNMEALSVRCSKRRVLTILSNQTVKKKIKPNP